LHANNIVTCENLEAAGLVAPEAPRFTPSSRTVPLAQGKRGYPDYNLLLRGAPLRADGSGKDRSKADAFWCKWADERGYSIEEIASELSRVSQKAQEQVVSGNTSYAIEKARWGVKVADMRSREGFGPHVSYPDRPRLDSLSLPIVSVATPAGDVSKLPPDLAASIDDLFLSVESPRMPAATPAGDVSKLPPDLAALVDEELGITADLFLPVESPRTPATELPSATLEPAIAVDPLDSLPGDIAAAVEEYRRVFDVRDIRVVRHDEERGIPYAQWKAAQLNRIFARQGALKEAGRITAETIQDGLDKESARKRGEFRQFIDLSTADRQPWIPPVRRRV
jgi:hypothetical protein